MINKIITFFLYAWQLPQIILGLFVLLSAQIYYKELNRSKWKSSWVFRYKLKNNFLWGVSFGPIIILSNHPYHSEKTVKHEFRHSIQSKYLGPLYLLAVGIVSFVRASFWFIYKIPAELYWEGYPEKWADKLGEVER